MNRVAQRRRREPSGGPSRTSAAAIEPGPESAREGSAPACPRPVRIAGEPKVGPRPHCRQSTSSASASRPSIRGA